MKRDVFLASLLFGILMFASFIVVYQYVLGTSLRRVCTYPYLWHCSQVSLGGLLFIT